MQKCCAFDQIFIIGINSSSNSSISGGPFSTVNIWISILIRQIATSWINFTKFSKKIIHVANSRNFRYKIFLKLYLETSIWFPTNPMLDRWCQRPLSARMAASSNTGFPVNLDKVPNSMMVVPTPAVHVTVVSPLGTPYLQNSKRITLQWIAVFFKECNSFSSLCNENLWSSTFVTPIY